MPQISSTRLALLGLFVLGLFGALLARLWFLQVLTEEEYQVQARANLIRENVIPAPRGRILDRNGNVLVDNKVTNLVVVDKFELYEALPGEEQRRELAERLAREISATGRLIKAQTIEDQFNDQRYAPFDTIPLATDVTEEFSILLGERLDEFPGVDVEPGTVRDYPYGNLAAHLLGRLGPISADELELRLEHPKEYIPNDEIGKTGAERAFEDTLRGLPGFERIEVDANNKIIRVLDDVEPIPGNDIRLTVDIDLQARVEFELRRAIEEARLNNVTVPGENPGDPSVVIDETFEAPGGASVILDPRNGEVLAMASYPTFDPQLFIGGISQEAFDQLTDPNAHKPLINRTIQENYPPGSTFKPFTAYAAFDNGLLGDRGVLDPDEYLRDPGVFFIPECDERSCRFQNANQQDNGSVNLRDALTVSSDVYFYRLGYEFHQRPGFPADGIQASAKLFGLGTPSGVALPGEAAGLMPTAELMLNLFEDNPEAFPFGNQWTTGRTVQVAIGQGDMALTPLQMATAYSVIANGGTLHQPQLALAEIDAVSDEVVREFGPRVVDELYLPEVWLEEITEGLRGVVTEAPLKGTAAKPFEDFPMLRWPVAGKTGTVETTDKQDSSVFVGFGPLPEPEYVMFSYLEFAGFGSDAAAPMVRRVFEAIATNDIDTVPTEEQIEEFWRRYRPDLSGQAEETVDLGEIGEDGLPVATPLPTPVPTPTPTPQPTAVELPADPSVDPDFAPADSGGEGP